jgi:glucose/arabinose dehydrogenase
VTGVQTGGEQGLLGLAFAPDYATTGRFYVDFTGPGGSGFANTINIREYTVSAGNPNVANAASARPILQVPHDGTNHNAGWIGFSPRAGDAGNLYITMGDGGGGNDLDNDAQTPTSLLGKMLRINVNRDDFPGDTTKNYGIPVNNPYANSTLGAAEVFTLGLRNPFRAGFDRQTGDLFIGDVGQGAREEVDVQKASNPGGGENYGWRAREGFIQNPAYPNETVPGAVDPIDDYPQGVGRSVIGGHVYRGGAIGSLAGKYVFGDYFGDNGAGDIFTLDYDGTTGSNFQTITGSLFPAGGLSGPAAFAEDPLGELYIVSQGTGEIYKIVPEPTGLGCAGMGAALLGLRRRRTRAAG